MLDISCESSAGIYNIIPYYILRYCPLLKCIGASAQYSTVLKVGMESY